MPRDHVSEFPWQRMVQREYADRIPRVADGSPPDGLYVEALEFDTFLYRTEPLTVTREFVVTGREKTAVSQNPVAKPCAFRFATMPYSQVTDICRSADLAISCYRISGYAVRASAPKSRRNLDGNELVFVHAGEGMLRTDFGVLNFTPGDFLFIPRGTIYRWEATAPLMAVIAETPASLLKPYHHWLSDFFPYDPAAIEPAHPIVIAGSALIENGGGWEVEIRSGGGYSMTQTYAFSPYNCAAWQGKQYPFKLSMEHIHAVSSPTFHLPPTAGTIFTTEDQGAMISVFKPRWIHSLPYNHRNTWQEFLFYHKGEYGARSGIGPGDATLHPAYMHHGPQPKKLAAWKRVPPNELPWRDEWAVMFESKSPFHLYDAVKPMLIEGYDHSWSDEWKEEQKA